MNNKVLGTQFEREFVEILKENGWWTHFITPNMAGAQPFDVIAVKNDVPVAIDCKTSVDERFPLSRLEYNQMFAFDLWEKKENSYAYIAVKYTDKKANMPYSEIYMISYDMLKEEKTVRLKDCATLKEWLLW